MSRPLLFRLDTPLRLLGGLSLSKGWEGTELEGGGGGGAGGLVFPCSPCGKDGHMWLAVLDDVVTVMTCLCHCREVIAVNQDPMGTQGKLIKSSAHWTKEGVGAGSSKVYSRPLKGGDVAVALLNTYSFSYPHNVTFNFKDVSERKSGKKGGGGKEMGRGG